MIISAGPGFKAVKRLLGKLGCAEERVAVMLGARGIGTLSAPGARAVEARCHTDIKAGVSEPCPVAGPAAVRNGRWFDKLTPRVADDQWPRRAKGKAEDRPKNPA
jgi:hypothetical protein